MKRILITIAFVGLSVLNFQALSQSVTTSEVDNYKYEIGEKTIIRTATNSEESLIYYEDSDGESYFLYRHNGTAETTCKINWPNYGGTGTHMFKIHDMAVGKGMCFFCGSHIGNAASSPVSTGLVGCIDLSNIAATPCTTASVTLYICSIPNTKVFTQMDEHYDNPRGISQLCMVGESTSATTPSCAAFVEWDPSNLKWYYRVVEVQDPNETMTDIAFSGLGTKVVAVSRYGNEPYKFGLRGEYTSNLFVFTTIGATPPPPPLPNFTHRNTVNTYGLYLASSSNPHPTWHENDIVARIVCPPNSEEFTVAYECVDNTKACESQRQVALFRIDVSTFPWNYNMNVTGKQIVRGYFEEGSTFTDMMYIPDNKTFALLHRSPNSSKGKSSALQFPSWLAYGNISTLISDATLHSSMDIREYSNNRYLTLVGINEDGHSICYFRQLIQELEKSCYQTRPVSISEELIDDDWATYQGVRNIDDNNHNIKNGYSGNGIFSDTSWGETCKSFE